MTTRYIDRIVSNHIKVGTLETDNGGLGPRFIEGDAPLNVSMPSNIMSMGSLATGTGSSTTHMFSIPLTGEGRRIISATVTIVGDITSTDESYISCGLIHNVRLWWDGAQYGHKIMNASNMDSDDITADVSIQVVNDVMDVLLTVTMASHVERAISMRLDIVPNVK